MRRPLPWLALSVALLAVGGAWIVALLSAGGGRPASGPLPPTSSPQLLPASRPAEPDPRFDWPAPQPLEAGSQWVYGVFTPPRLYLEPSPGGGPLRFRFAPSPGAALAEADEPETFGLRLVRAEPVPFRFQVIGVAGRGDSSASPRLVLLTDLESPPDQPRVFVLAPGEANLAKGLRLEAVERVVREPARGGVAVEYLARVREATTGTRYRLSSRAPLTVGDPVLYYAATDAEEAGEIRGPGEGGVLRVGERSYRVDRIDPAAGLVRVSRRHPRGGARWTEEWSWSGDPADPVSPPALPPGSPTVPAESRPRPALPGADPS